LNTGAIFAESQIGNPTFLDYLKRFGLGQKTGFGLQESSGDLSNLSVNAQVNYDTASFGQGINVTPLQLVQAYGALANGGKMMKPYIVDQTVTADGKATVTGPVVANPSVVSQQTASTISAMLVDVVEHGLGKKAAIPGYYVAGKTGTAQVSLRNSKGYEPNINIGTFIGYAPVEDPRFVMIVRMNHPRDVKFAEVTAAPAWHDIAQFILNYYNIPPNRPLDPTKK
jgi:stage V sporulation protein D (sporulation-specific penicillin-binding protein)